MWACRQGLTRGSLRRVLKAPAEIRKRPREVGVSGRPGSAPLWSRGSEAGLLRQPPPFPTALGSGCQDSSPALLPGACHTGRIAGRIASFPCWRSADGRSTCLTRAAVGIKCTDAIRELRMGAALGGRGALEPPPPSPSHPTSLSPPHTPPGPLSSSLLQNQKQNLRATHPVRCVS